MKLIIRRGKERRVSCSRSQDGTMIACGSINQFFTYNINTGKTSVLAIKQTSGSEVIIWNIHFLDSDRYSL